MNLPFPFGPLLSFIYGAIVLLRLFLFRVGLLKTRRSSSFVISVGNLSVGGTGKTPLVHFLYHFLREKKLSVAILSRGYGTGRKDLRILHETSNPSPSIYGDEPVMLSGICPGAKIYVCPNRRLSSQIAEKEHSVLLLDDGFQHLRLERDINIAVIDCIAGLGNGHLMPRGILREPISALQRADLILLTKANLGGQKEQILNRIQFLKNTPIFESTNHIRSFLDSKGQRISPKEMNSAGILLLSGIGKPAGFEKLLALCGIQFSKHLKYSDHHQYTLKDFEQINDLIKTGKYKTLITTEKDYVKLNPEKFSIPVFRTEMEIRMDPELNRYLDLKIEKIWKK